MTSKCSLTAFFVINGGSRSFETLICVYLFHDQTPDHLESFCPSLSLHVSVEIMGEQNLYNRVVIIILNTMVAKVLKLS